jgi:hypothetical protein
MMDITPLGRGMIKYISDYFDPSLKQRSNVITFVAGTNDMSSNLVIGAAEENDPAEVVSHSGDAIDETIRYFPDVTILIALIILFPRVSKITLK